MIRVLGAGAFGTALAIALARNGPVTLWARDPAQAQAMAATRENAARLPGCPLPAAVHVTAEFDAPDFDAPDEDTPCLLAVPMQRLRDLLTTQAVRPGRAPLVACCKGIERESGQGPASVIADVLPGARAAVLTGPSFAADIARGMPTALTLACADDTLGRALQARLSTGSLRLYRTRDVAGAELGGALKNVMAIACGAAIGAGLGESARAALMTRGFAEMQRLARAAGAAPDTLAGLSGFGDLVLTCCSEQSRNTRFGMSLGRGASFDPSVTVEGAATARAALSLAESHRIDTPIIRTVAALCDGKLQVAQAMDMLLRRPLKEE